MKKKSYILLFFLVFALFITKTYAITIRETMDENDGYSTLEEGSIIIGITRFSSNNIVTASKAATAGVNDVMLYMSKNGNTDGYEMPGVYYYVDSYVGWFFLDVNNKATPVENEEELEELSKLDIYYVDNVEKVLEVDFPNNNIDESTLPNGVTFKDNKLFINATIEKIEFKTNDDKNVSFVMDPTTSKFIEDIKTCYTVSNGMITSYNKDCGSEVIIPLEINNEKIIGIGPYAFKDTNLISVIIPNQIESLGSYAFADNKLESVIIKDKYNESDFSFNGDNVFGEFNNVTYENVLTRILNLVDTKYVVNHYKNFDTKKLISEEDGDFRLTGYIGNSLIKKFENNGYSKNYIYCGENCEHYLDLEDEKTKDIYGVSLEKKDNLSYKFTIQNYDNNRINKVSKNLTVSFNETGTKEDNDIVQEAFNKLEIDHRVDHVYGTDRRNTRMKSLQDLEDIYDINIVLQTIGCGIVDWENEEMITHHCGYATYYSKDNVLYQYESELGVASITNSYHPKQKVEDYENIDAYVEHILSLFPKLSGVTNYEIEVNEDGKIYKEGDKFALYDYETAINYNIDIYDKDYSETWTISFADFYDDKHDENGYTKEECFKINEGIITDYDGKCGINVIIPDTINGMDVLEIGDSVFENMQLKSVRLPSKLKKIGNNAFRENLLTNIDIPNTVTNIGDFAFYYNSLTSINIPDSVEEIGYAVFSNNKIESVNLGINVKSIDKYAFSSNKIKELEIPSSVKIIEYGAFEYNEIEILELHEGIEEIASVAFYNNKIKTLNFPNSLKKIGTQAFTNNQLPDEEAFIYNRKYEKGYYIWDYETINSYGGANRDNVVIPDNVVTIGEAAFYGCGIKKVKLPANLKTINYEAFGYNNLSSIDIPYGVETIASYSFNENKITFVVIPDSVKNMYDHVFINNQFEGENSFIYSKDKNNNIDYTNLVAYYNKTYEIDEVVIPKTVKKIGQYAFSSNSINKIDIPYGVEEIGYGAFFNLTIKEISLPKSLKKIGTQIFDTSHDISKEQGYVYAKNEDGTIDKTILMAYIAYIEDGVLAIPEGIVEIRENVFYYKTELKEVTLPNTLEKIGNKAFYSIRAKEITIPSNVKIIGDNAFDFYDKTSTITIENKTSPEDFEYLGNNPFGSDSKVIYKIIEVNSIMLNKNSTKLSVGDTETLKLTIKPTNATHQDVKWHSSNPKVATVENGVITTLSEGTTIITASVNNYKTTCKVTVTETYSYIWEKIDVSTIDEHYLYIVNSKGEKVNGKVNITYQNEHAKEYEIPSTGLKLIKPAISKVEIISTN